VRDREVPDRQRQDRGRAEVGDGDPIHQGYGCERRRVEHDADALDPRLSSDG
jgi:hypothetical protein